MTALPALPRPPLTIDDWVAMPYDEFDRWELSEGNLVMTPSPVPRHSDAIFELTRQLRAASPRELIALGDTDLDLQLAAANRPATIRRPDVSVVTRAEYDRVNREGKLLRAEATVLVVEVLSPGSLRADRIIKYAEYADAGIPHYWIVDLDAQSAITCELVDGAYLDTPRTGAFTIDRPFPVEIDLTTLG